MTVVSLLLGAVATIAGLYLFYGPPPAAGQLPVIAWNAATARVDSGAGTPTGQDLQLQLNNAGQAIIALSVPRVNSSHYPFLRLAIADAPENLTLLILWRTTQTGKEVLEYQFQLNSREALWLATHKFAGWRGDITSLGLVILGRPGQEVTVRDVSLLPPTLTTQLAAIFSSWTSFSPWNHSSINHHTGVGPGSSYFYPVPFIMAFCTLSMLAYGLLFLLLRRNTRFNWRVVAAIFLSCWISLDMVWQGKLLQQLGKTQETFSGMDTMGKLAAGLDAELVELMVDVKDRLQSKDSRIFVSSADDYLGMRGAYYLYPFNVLWQRHGPELPPVEYLHRGDYIVLVEPTKFSFDPATNTLHAPRSKAFSVEPVFSRRMGSLFRVK